MEGADVASLILRLGLGVTMVAHGWNHAFGGGRLPGTARWFESIGIRPGRLHAAVATFAELGAGILLLIGLFTSVAATAVVGTMVVALVANHWRNGFFIFRPGEGYEYVLNLILAGCAVGALGGGSLSADEMLDLHLDPWLGLGLAAGGGAAGAVALLAACWRPNRPVGAP